jgi:hypothetical protein
VRKRTNCEAHDGNRTHDLFLTKEVLCRLSYVGKSLIYSPPSQPQSIGWSGKRGSNPRPRAWKARALPTELFPLANRIINDLLGTWRQPTRELRRFQKLSPAFSVGFYCPYRLSSPTAFSWWRGEDSNLRRHKPADLQSAPFGRSGTSPRDSSHRARRPRSLRFYAVGRTSADGENRTRNLLITSQLLYL